MSKRWKADSLNQVGKPVLIQSVINALPISQFPVCWFSASILAQLDLIILNFFFQNNVGLHLVKWDTLTGPKLVAWRDNVSNTFAITAPFIFKLLTDSSLPWVNLMHAKYGNLNPRTCKIRNPKEWRDLLFSRASVDPWIFSSLYAAYFYQC